MIQPHQMIKSLNMQELIYLAGPYSHDPEAAYNTHLDYTAALFKEGLLVFSPIVHCHAVAVKHELPTSAKFWEEYDLRMLKAANWIFVIDEPGWDASAGVMRELAAAAVYKLTIAAIKLENGQLSTRPLRRA